MPGSPTPGVDKGRLSYWKSLRRAVPARELEEAGKKAEMLWVCSLQEEDMGSKE